MAGMPIRRARKALKKHQEELRRLDELAQQPATDDPDKPSGTIPPVGPHKYAWMNRMFKPEQEVVPDKSDNGSAHKATPPATVRAPGAAPALPPLDAEESAIFHRIRKLALQKLEAFVKMDLDPNDKNYARFTAKQLEICSQLASLSGRIDPSALKGVQQDTLGEMLAALKAEVPSA